MNKIIALVFMISLLFVSNALASGNELLKNCQSAMDAMDNNRSRDMPGAALCLGYVGGFISLNMAYQIARQSSSGETPTPFFCLPLSLSSDQKNMTMAVSNGQAARVVFKFLKDHPERLREDDAVLTIDALRQAYPCNLKTESKAKTSTEEEKKMYKEMAELVNEVFVNPPKGMTPEERKEFFDRQQKDMDKFIDDYFRIRR